MGEVPKDEPKGEEERPKDEEREEEGAEKVGDDENGVIDAGEDEKEDGKMGCC